VAKMIINALNVVLYYRPNNGGVNHTLYVIGWLSLVLINGYDGKYVQLIYWVRNGENKTPVDDYSKY